MRVQNENFAPGGSIKYNFQLPVYNYEAHIHQYAEIGYVISGELEVIVNQQPYRVRAGEFLFIFPMQIHEYRTPEQVEYMVSAFSGALVEDVLSDAEGLIGKTPVFRCTESIRQFFHATFVDGELDDGCKIDRGYKPGDVKYTDTHIVDYTAPDKRYRVKACLYAALGEYRRTVEFVPATGDANVLAQVMFYLHHHYREPITLASVASALGYSANYLSHCIKKTCGMNFATLVGNLRVEYAQHLLRSGDKNILDIALECGFGTERSFHRMFKRIAGCTPGEFIRTK